MLYLLLVGKRKGKKGEREKEESGGFFPRARGQT
jgi:hypothetical protein